MSEQKDKQALEEYLKGDSDLSRRYRAESKAEPPAHLDAAIISAAQKTLNNNKAGAGPSISRWYVPLSLAAVLVISFSLVFRIYDQDVQPVSGKQAEMKKEKPAVLMDTKPEPAAAPPAVLMRDEFHSSEEIRIETDAASATRAAPAAGEDISKDDALSEMEADPSATQSVESLSIPAERRMQESESVLAEDLATTGSTLQPQQWFEIINQLWFDGDEAGAMDATRRFLETYPDYPPDELKMMLPQEMDLSEITTKRALTP